MANYNSKYSGAQHDAAVAAFLNGTGGSSVAVDATLKVSGAAADAKVTGDKIAALTEEMGGITAEMKSISDGFFEEGKAAGKNLLNPNTCVPGYLNNGVLTASSDWVTCDYIYVGNLANIISSKLPNSYTASMFFLNTYDKYKNFISMDSMHGHTYAVEDGVAYIRFAIKTDTDPADVQVESGTVITAFEPYTETSAKIPKKVWTGKKWVVIGDSLTEANGRASMRYHDYIAESTGISVVNLGASGTGYAKGADNSNAFYHRIANVPTDADVVTIFGSFNDSGTLGAVTDTGTDTICGCINTTLDNLFAAFPLVNLGIVSPTPWNDKPSAEGAHGQYVTALESICKSRGIPFLNLYYCSGLRPWDEAYKAIAYSKDDGNGVHPDEKGHALIAPRFKAFLETLIL